MSSLLRKAQLIREELSERKTTVDLMEDSIGLFKPVTGDSNIGGVWDEDDQKVLLVFNTKKKVVRIREDSPLLPMLQGRKDWTVVGSKTLDKYADKTSAVSRRLRRAKIAVPTAKAILDAKPGDVVRIDLGPPNGRSDVYYDVASILERKEGAERYRAFYEACYGVGQRNYKVTIPPKNVTTHTGTAYGYRVDMPF